VYNRDGSSKEIDASVGRLEIIDSSVTKIDLSSLGQNYEVTEILIARTSIDEIDLSPLENCFNLSNLTLKGSWTVKGKKNVWISPYVNLNPLVLCPKLSEVELDGLSLVPKMKKKFESDEFSHMIDFVISLHIPLYQSVFRMLNVLELNRLKYITKPVESSEYIRYVVESRGWGYLKELLHLCENEHDQMLWGWNLAQILGYPELAGFDDILADNFFEELEGYDFDSGRKHIYDLFMKILSEQVTKGGTTIFMDIQKMAQTPAAVFISKILELRTREMKRVKLSKPFHETNLLPLVLTAHGFRIIQALNMKITAKRKDLEVVTTAIKEAGLPPITFYKNYVDTIRPVTPVSRALIQIVHYALGWYLDPTSLIEH